MSVSNDSYYIDTSRTRRTPDGLTRQEVLSKLLNFSPSFLNEQTSTSLFVKLNIASSAEIIDGTDALKIVTPAGLVGAGIMPGSGGGGISTIAASSTTGASIIDPGSTSSNVLLKRFDSADARLVVSNLSNKIAYSIADNYFTTIGGFGAMQMRNNGGANITILATSNGGHIQINPTGNLVLNSGHDFFMGGNFTNAGDLSANGFLSNGATTTVFNTGNVNINSTLGNIVLSTGIANEIQISGKVNMTNKLITNLASPINPSDATTKGYVDAVAQGFGPKLAVLAKTTDAEANDILNNGIFTGAGIGKTIVNDGALVEFSADSAVCSVGDRILFVGSGASEHYGIYTITTLGSSSIPWVLTRSTDADNSPTTGEVVPGIYTFITSGTTHALQGWSLISFAGSIDVSTQQWSPVTQACSGATTLNDLTDAVNNGNNIALGKKLLFSGDNCVVTSATRTAVIPLSNNTIYGSNSGTFYAGNNTTIVGGYNAQFLNTVENSTIIGANCFVNSITNGITSVTSAVIIGSNNETIANNLQDITLIGRNIRTEANQTIAIGTTIDVNATNNVICIGYNVSAPSNKNNAIFIQPGGLSNGNGISPISEQISPAVFNPTSGQLAVLRPDYSNSTLIYSSNTGTYEFGFASESGVEITEFFPLPTEPYSTIIINRYDVSTLPSIPQVDIPSVPRTLKVAKIAIANNSGPTLVNIANRNTIYLDPHETYNYTSHQLAYLSRHCEVPFSKTPCVPSNLIQTMAISNVASFTTSDSGDVLAFIDQSGPTRVVKIYYKNDVNYIDTGIVFNEFPNNIDDAKISGDGKRIFIRIESAIDVYTFTGGFNIPFLTQFVERIILPNVPSVIEVNYNGTIILCIITDILRIIGLTQTGYVLMPTLYPLTIQPAMSLHITANGDTIIVFVQDGFGGAFEVYDREYNDLSTTEMYKYTLTTTYVNSNPIFIVFPPINGQPYASNVSNDGNIVLTSIPYGNNMHGAILICTRQPNGTFAEYQVILNPDPTKYSDFGLATRLNKNGLTITALFTESTTSHSTIATYIRTNENHKFKLLKDNMIQTAFSYSTYSTLATNKSTFTFYNPATSEFYVYA